MESNDDASTVEFDSKTETYRLAHDWRDDRSLTSTVIDAVSAVTNTPSTEIDPLYESVNPDALNAVYEPTHAGELRREGGCISFRVDDCDVTVYWDGIVEIRPPDGVRRRNRREE